MCKLFKKFKSVLHKTEEPYIRHVKTANKHVNLVRNPNKHTCNSYRNYNRALFRNKKVIQECNTLCCIGCKHIKTCSFPCPMRHNCTDYD